MARYVTYYEEYPIYEPAEGRYYYPGNEVVSYKKLSHNQTKKEIARIWENCKKENLAGFGEETPWK